MDTDGLQTVVENPKTTNKIKKIAHFLILLVFVAGTSLGSYILGKHSADKTTNNAVTTNGSKTKTTAIPNWAKPASKSKGYPLYDFNSKDLKIYSVAQKKVVTHDKYKLGSSVRGVLVSPDRLYTVFINSDSNLWLLSNETLEATKITQNGFVSEIIDWSKDSKKIVYNYKEDTLSSRNNIPHGGTEPKLTFKPQPEVGIHQFNIDTGVFTPLAALNDMEVYDIEGFIDSDRLLVRIGESDNKSLVTFNTTSLVADQTAVTGNYGFGTGQFDFSSDSALWTYTTSKNPTNDAIVVVGSFPKPATTVIDAGAWADVQHSRFSPDNSMVAYRRREGEMVNGVPHQALWIYDMNTKQKAKYGDGLLVDWLDNQTVVIMKNNAKGYDRDFALIDITTKKVTDL